MSGERWYLDLDVCSVACSSGSTLPRPYALCLEIDMEIEIEKEDETERERDLSSEIDDTEGVGKCHLQKIGMRSVIGSGLLRVFLLLFFFSSFSLVSPVLLFPPSSTYYIFQIRVVTRLFTSFPSLHL